MFIRSPQNPLITPKDVQPSRPDFEVIGAFNAGVTLYNDEVILLVRVAERPKSSVDNVVRCPQLTADGEIIIREIPRDHPDYDTTDPRKVEHRKTGEFLLTSISHLRLARSLNGEQFTVETQPWLFPSDSTEAFGVEDARITQIDDRYYVNYSAVSRYGITTALVSTDDFSTYARHGIIFPPANRDVALFPQKINGLYACYHRPMPGYFGGFNMWSATSPDLVHWGHHQMVLEATPDGWASGRVGGGAPPIYTDAGWLSIYHAADRRDRYCLSAFLTPHDQPSRIIRYSRQPILSPDAPYEAQGFFPNVVFSCGAIVQGDMLRVYYGAADESIALAEMPLAELIESLESVNDTQSG